MLELLLRRQGSVVTREAIEQAAVWLRRASGVQRAGGAGAPAAPPAAEAARRPRIHTLRGVGYLLAAAE